MTQKIESIFDGIQSDSSTDSEMSSMMTSEKRPRRRRSIERKSDKRIKQRVTSFTVKSRNRAFLGLVSELTVLIPVDRLWSLCKNSRGIVLHRNSTRIQAIFAIELDWNYVIADFDPFHRVPRKRPGPSFARMNGRIGPSSAMPRSSICIRSFKR